MSLQVIEDCISSFLHSDKAEVLAIRGHWGVGKTFFWNKFLLERSKVPSAISSDKYAYVSLFGLNNLEALKFAIFENTVSNSLIGKETSLETFSKNVDGISGSLSRKALNAVFSLKPLKGFSAAMESVAWLSVRKTLICVDDLERKGSNLSLKDTLGLISYLKENRGCKFVLLLNDNEEGLDEYSRYREKVVDIELTFAPSAEECASIAISPTTLGLKILKEFSILAGVSNIRTIPYLRSGLCLIVSDYANRPFIPPIRQHSLLDGSFLRSLPACLLFRSRRSGSGLLHLRNLPDRKVSATV